MRKFQRYQKKIRKYLKKISKSKFRKKLKNLLIQVGIRTQRDFYIEKEISKFLVFPCHAGILFFGDYTKELFDNIYSVLETIFPSFFYNIINLGEFKFPKEIFLKGIQRAHKNKEVNLKKMDLHPTNKFYQILIELRKKNNLDIIIALTDLPIYSSNNQNIVFLFGETHLKQKLCIVSSLKLKEKFYEREKNLALFRQRVIKEIIHEVGHLIIGKGHCKDKACVMSYSTNIEQVDKKATYLCIQCRKKLELVKQEYNI